jgi:drug/metabolite transporter (DMT)-like permease
MSKESTISATFLGYIALAMWASSGVLASSVIRIPTFEVLSIAFSISFGFTAILLTAKGQWYKVKQPLILWVIGMIGVYGNDALFIAAFKYAPAAQADLINYLYPVLIIIFASFLPSEKFSWKYILAAFLGFSGTYLIVTGGHNFAGFHSQYIYGYLLALLDAIVWSAYCLVARHYKSTPSEMVGMYCGCGLILSLIAHFNFEPTIIPSGNEIIVMIIMGLTTQGSAYFLWDYGIKKGNFKFLSIISYTNPIIAVFLLVMTGRTNYSNVLLVSTFLIATGGAIAGLDLTSLTKTLSLFIQRLSGYVPRERHD